MEALIIAVMGAVNILCFMVGAKVGQKVSRGEEVELPKVNPVEAVREHKKRVRAEREMDRVSSIMQNIENYQGSSIGQRDVPEG